MSRYLLTEYENASLATQEIYDDYLRVNGTTSLPNWLKSLGHKPELARAYWERAKGSFFSGNLPQSLKSMIFFVVSAHNGAKYCAACHAQSVLELDTAISLDDLQVFLKSNSSSQFPSYYRSVVTFTDKVITNPNQLNDADFDEIMDDGFNRDEISEIIGVIDLAAMFNVYTSAMSLELDPEYHAII
jgi:uncharacterized peroxidase-related enzyme